jgi:hypothetical protein
VCFEEWSKAKCVFDARQEAARNTTKVRSPRQKATVTVDKQDGQRTVTDNTASRSADTITLTGTITTTEKTKKQKTSSKPKEEKPVDQRRKDFIDDLALHWKGFAKTKFVFDGADGTQVDLFLKTWPDLSREQWRDCLRNRKKTPGVIPTERIYRWISKLGNYLNGSLDEYGKLANGNGGNHAAVSGGTGNKIVGVVNNALGRTECEDTSREDGDLPPSIEVGRGNARNIHADANQPRFASFSGSDEEYLKF